jgi:hypothetical protein
MNDILIFRVKYKIDLFLIYDFINNFIINKYE